MFDPDRQSDPRSSSDRYRDWSALATLLALVFLAYAPVVGAGWVWDDDSYVTANPLLDPELPVHDALRLIWTPGATPQYYPAVFTSFLIESRLYSGVTGDEFASRPLGFHLTNVVLHATSAVLLWRILRSLGVPGAWLAAAVFAVHPMNVESVAWVTERKNVLALACGLGAIACWLRGVRDLSAGWCGAALAFFLAGMLAKTTIAAVAPALVLVHLWRRDRLTLWMWAMLAAFFAIGIALGLNTAHLERAHVGAEGNEFALSFAQRLALAPRATLFYAWTFFWPSRLAFIYPRWTIDTSSFATWIPLVAVLGTLGGSIVAWLRGWRGPLVLVLLVGAALFPALGFIDVYPFRYSYVADHFAYLATVPFAIIGAWVLTRLARRIKPRLAMVAAGLLLAISAVATAAQTLAYRNEETLWRASLASNPDAWMPWSNLSGVVVRQAGAARDLGQEKQSLALAEESEHCARRAIAISDVQATTWTNLSEALRLQQRFTEALAAADRAIALAPDLPDVHWRRGRLLELTGDFPAAINAYQAAVERPDLLRAPTRFGPDNRTRRLDLARALTRADRVPEAVKVFEALLAERPTDSIASANLARCRASLGDLPGARAAFRVALESAPDVAFAIALVPGFVDAMLALPSDKALAEEARQAAEWLNDRTGGSDPLVLVLLARTRAALGERDAAKELLDDARRRANDAPAAVRDEIDRRAAELAETH